MKLIKQIGIISLISLMGFIIAINANAQTAPQTSNKPEFLMSWKTDSYAPAWYSGRIFPTKSSRIEVSFELFNNGKIVDISKNKVRWYVNDDLRKNEEDGLGIKSYNFTSTDYPGEDIEVRIVIFDYKNNKEEIEEIGKIVKIPVVSPEAVIDAPYSNRLISSGASSFAAYPFFFNIKGLTDISFGWAINGRITEGGVRDSGVLNLNIDSLVPSGFDVKVGLSIKNLLNEMEFASNNIKLVIK